MKIYTVIFFILFIVACSDNSKNNKISTLVLSINNNDESILITTDTIKQEVNSNFEHLDIEWLEKNGEKNSFGKGKFSYRYEYKTDSSYIQINGDNVNGYSSNEYLQGKYFYTFKNYYKNGNIKEKGLCFHLGSFKKGVWYEFNISGKLVETVDYDQFYKFTFEDILRLCEKRNLFIEEVISSSDSDIPTTISRYYHTELKHIWVINWLKTSTIMQTLTIDGNTGKVIKTEDSRIYQ